MPFEFRTTAIPDVVRVTPKVFGDRRGWFAEVYKSTDFREAGIARPFVQVNHSHSARGILRGLHYQLNPMAQGKLVSCVRGEIFDVAVDLRSGSPTNGQWVGERLDGESKAMLFIPEGLAHGFCVLSAEADVIYYCTEVYSPAHERGIRWDDPDLAVAWPVEAPVVSDKDRALPGWKAAERNFTNVTV